MEPRPTIEAMRKVAWFTSEILIACKNMVEDGCADLNKIEDMAAAMIEVAGATSYNKGYAPVWAETPYPSVLCTSVNFEAAHCPPAGRTLKEGDIVIFDVGIKLNGACGDSALTVAVGKIDNRKERLIRHAKRALEEGISVVGPGVDVRVIGQRIEGFAMKHGYRIIREFGGHGIGAQMHEDPMIYHYGHSYPKEQPLPGILVPGMVICIEPILTPGDGRIWFEKDGWRSGTIDAQPCAMFEDMCLVKEDGVEVLTHHNL